LRRYIIKRLLLLIPVLLGVSVIVFVVMHMFTTDPAYTILGQHATQTQVDELRAKLDLDKPIYVQYAKYLGKLLKGDLGESLYTKTSVTKELSARFPATIELALCAMIFASLLGILVGVISAVKKNSIFDYVSMLGALTGVSMPIFWLGIMLIILFAVNLHLLPPAGRIDITYSPVKVTGLLLVDTLIKGDWKSFQSALSHLVLPTIALGLYSTAIIARMTRSSVLETLEQDYIRTAWAKGLSERVVVMRHALRNALIPVVTVIGLQMGQLLAGAVLTETVFAWPGIGKYVVDSIIKTDYPVVQGAVLLVAFIFVAVNLIVDIVYAFLDPRIKYS